MCSRSSQDCRSAGADSACCRPNRRELLQLAGAGLASSLLSHLPAVAGPFTAADFEKLIPADKKLAPDWIASLTAKGNRAVYRGPELEKIGMPVGGLCAGQLYLGGDGTLWHWDIFNEQVRTGAGHYAKPMTPVAPLDQGFALRWQADAQWQHKPLNSRGFAEVSFAGEYPMGLVEYRDPGCPLHVSLEAFSPFVPLKFDDSSFPATVLRFTVRNASQEAIDAELLGWLENAVALHHGSAQSCEHINRIVRDSEIVLLDCAARRPAQTQPAPPRPKIVFADFERETYGDWRVEGKAFGDGPARGPRKNQRLAGFLGKGLVNSWTGTDALTGKLISPEFTIERRYICFLLGGGNHPQQTCVNLLVEGQVVRRATGKNADTIEWTQWNVADLAGKKARIEIVDAASGAWGHIDVDQIEFCDTPRGADLPLEVLPDFGTMTLALLEPRADDRAVAAGRLDERGEPVVQSEAIAQRPWGEKLVGLLGRKLKLAAGQSATVTFIIAWHFPNLRMAFPKEVKKLGRYYATRFSSAVEAARQVAGRLAELYRQTKLWHDTWYDSTLPWWFLERTFVNTSILATSTCHRFANGRFYGWEGVGCCPGTCTHVWHYAQAVGRLFPELERILREHADFAEEVAFDPASGKMGFRGEFQRKPAIDGQAGVILRTYREHQMSADDAFLRRLWPKAKKALEFLIDCDGNGDGLIEGAQHNTLDADWHGPVAWLSGLYLAALLAGAHMADELSDAEFAQRCRAIVEKGRQRIAELLFSGEYFVNRPDPQHPEAINSGTGCHIDQVFGQSWAFQVGLGRVFSAEHARAALKALWKYNFTPDVGPFREANKPGRWYAMPGEGGLIMCTFPRADWTFAEAQGKGRRIPGVAGYFNECMNGFEYQVAGHMLWEGMLTEGLAVARMLHDRHHPLRRNPYNEIECGDHYARSMASYGVYLAACGFRYHGPKGELGFDPRLKPEDFRAAFTAAEGWGTFAQQSDAKGQKAQIVLKYGKLRLRRLSLGLAGQQPPVHATVTLAGGAVPHTLETSDGQCHFVFPRDVLLTAGDTLTIEW